MRVPARAKRRAAATDRGLGTATPAGQRELRHISTPKAAPDRLAATAVRSAVSDRSWVSSQDPPSPIPPLGDPLRRANRLGNLWHELLLRCGPATAILIITLLCVGHTSLLGWIGYSWFGLPQDIGELMLWCITITALVAPLQAGILVSAVHQIEDARSKLERLASTDLLTQTYNRRAFEARLLAAFSRARACGSPLSVLMIDVDHFKSVNDRFGHASGDVALFTVAERCRVALRHGDVLARYGGEEFAVVLPEASAERAVEVAERLRTAVAEAKVARDAGDGFGVTVSVGVSALHSADESPEDLLRRADQCLYQAKASGRNRCAA